jgi:hypothetical protein
MSAMCASLLVWWRRSYPGATTRERFLKQLRGFCGSRHPVEGSAVPRLDEALESSADSLEPRTIDDMRRFRGSLARGLRREDLRLHRSGRRLRGRARHSGIVTDVTTASPSAGARSTHRDEQSSRRVHERGGRARQRESSARAKRTCARVGKRSPGGAPYG